MKRLAVVGLIALPGCSSLNEVEQKQWENLRARDAPMIERKSPAIACALNLFAAGDAYNGQWDAFALDFLLWPVSIVWAMPQAAVTADNINKRATIAHYTVGAGKGQYDANTPPHLDAPRAAEE